MMNKHLSSLHRKYPKAFLRPASDSRLLVTIPEFLLPDGYNKTTTTLRFFIDDSDSNQCPSDFYVDEDLLLQDGRHFSGTGITNLETLDFPVKWCCCRVRDWDRKIHEALTYARVIWRGLAFKVPGCSQHAGARYV